MKKLPDIQKRVKKIIVEQHETLRKLTDDRGELQELEKLVADLEAKVHVGTKIRNLRDNMRLSQDDIASNTGLSQSYISRIEKGEAAPSKEVLERIAVPLKTNLTTLVKGTASVSALEEPTFAERHAYCPNIECPGTAYGYWDDGAEAWRTLTVEEFWKEKYDGGEPLSEWRKRQGVSLEVIYRWIELDENTNYCELCGTKLRNSCPSCQIPLKIWNQRFCHHCAVPLNKLPEHEKGGEKGIKTK